MATSSPTRQTVKVLLKTYAGWKVWATMPLNITAEKGDNIPVCRTWKATFEYRPGHSVIRAVQYVIAPNKRFAIWNTREQRHGCILSDPDRVSVTVAVHRQRNMCR